MYDKNLILGQNKKKSNSRLNFLFNGAPEDINFKLIDNLFSDVRKREDVIKAFEYALMQEAIYNPSIKSILPSKNLSPIVI